MNARKQKFLLYRVYQSRDTNAYGELYDENYSGIRRYLFFKLPTPQDADELTSEVFLRAWEYATATRVENASALFYNLARRLVADFYRRYHETEELTAEHHPQVSEVENYEVKDEHTHVLACLHKIKDEYRELIVLRYLNEMSVSEIARALEKTPNNVRVSLYRARRALKQAAEKR